MMVWPLPMNVVCACVYETKPNLSITRDRRAREDFCESTSQQLDCVKLKRAEEEKKKKAKKKRENKSVNIKQPAKKQPSKPSDEKQKKSLESSCSLFVQPAPNKDNNVLSSFYTNEVKTTHLKGFVLPFGRESERD